MNELSGLQIFKYLPAAKKAEHTNCKECGCPTCMAFALKLAKKQLEPNLCKYIPEELSKKLEVAVKIPQKTIEINNLKIGGENVMFRHEKTFVNPTALAVIINTDKNNWHDKLKRLEQFEITRVNENFKIDLIIFKGSKADKVKCNLNFIAENNLKLLPLKFVNDTEFLKTTQTLMEMRKKSVIDKDENCQNPVCGYMKKDITQEELCARAAFYICKYANMLVFEDFDEALFTTLITLRQNIFTDPQKPMQVESKIYEFNNPDENSLIFLTTNFALTFFAVANELENLKEASYLVVVPADGMSVLTAWSAEKFTAQKVVKTLKKYNFSSRVKNKKIIIPGLFPHMKDELQMELNSSGEDFEIIIGTIDAFAIPAFVKSLTA